MNAFIALHTLATESAKGPNLRDRPSIIRAFRDADPALRVHDSERWKREKAILLKHFAVRNEELS